MSQNRRIPAESDILQQNPKAFDRHADKAEPCLRQASTIQVQTPQDFSGSDMEAISPNVLTILQPDACSLHWQYTDLGFDTLRTGVVHHLKKPPAPVVL